jgi:hypothetical protein
VLFPPPDVAPSIKKIVFLYCIFSTLGFHLELLFFSYRRLVLYLNFAELFAIQRVHASCSFLLKLKYLVFFGVFPCNSHCFLDCDLVCIIW